MEFTNSFITKMEELMKAGRFYDSDLRSRVNNYVYDNAESMDEETLGFFDRLDDAETEEEYWNIIHLVAELIGFEK